MISGYDDGATNIFKGNLLLITQHIPDRPGGRAEDVYNVLRASIAASLGGSGQFVQWKQEILSEDERITVSHEDTILLLALALLSPDLPDFTRKQLQIDDNMAVNNNNVRLMDMKAEILRQADLFMAADSSVVNTRESKDYQNFNHELLPDQFDTSSMEDRGLLSTEENLIMEFKVDQDQKEEPSTDQGWLTDAANKIDPLTDIDQGKLDVNDFKGELEYMDLDVDKEENEGQPFCEQTDQKLALASAEAINHEEIEQDGDNRVSPAGNMIKQDETSAKKRKYNATNQNKPPFSCTECEYVTNRSHDLRRHQKVHTRTDSKIKKQPIHKKKESKERKNETDLKKKYSCNKCDFSVASKVKLQRHQRDNHKKKFPCNKCVFISSSSKKLKTHKEANHKNEHPCDHCDFVGDNARSLDEHRINSTKEHEIAAIESKKFHCDKCNFVTLKEYLLNIHKEAKHSDQVYMCDKCDYKHPNLSNLKLHIGSKHAGSVYACDLCDYKAVSSTNLYWHKQKMHDNSVHSCDKCTYTTPWKNSLNRHIRIIHEGFRYSCYQCEYKTTKASCLKEHIKVKHEGFEYRCDQCEFTGTSLEGLKHHVKLKHDRVRLTCALCDFAAASKLNLRLHMSARHPGETRAGDDLQCDQCEFRTDTRISLTCHISAVHRVTGGTQRCKLCDFIGEDRQELTEHTKAKHGGQEEVSLTCDHCDFVSTTSSSALYHLAAVHKVGAYACDQCEYVAAFPSTLKKHKERHGRYAPT